MRVFSSNIQSVLNSDSIEFFFLIELFFASTYRLTSYSSNIVFDGNTYTSDGGVFEIDSPNFSTVVDREAYKVVISDPENDLLSELNSNIVGKEIRVRVGFIDENTGQPLISNTDDVLYVYKGYVDKPAITNDFENKLVTLEGTSPMSDLDGVRSFLTSKDSIQNFDSTDTSFDTVHDNYEIDYKWGKV